MEPPPLAKMVDRPRVKRTREKDEARKREGIWSASKKGLRVTCGYCSAPRHNIRRCPIVKGKHNLSYEETSQSLEDIHMKAPQDSQDSEFVFIPVPGLNMSSNQSSSHSSQHEYDSTFQSEANTQFYDVDEIRCEYDPTLMPKVISEANTRLKQRQLLQNPTGTGKINFMGDENGVYLPSNLPYSPKKITWEGKAAMTSNQLVEEKERRITKLKAKRAML
ncbi:uncharacterized protein [Nicotiana tomentosiformis]|uniref:uncharacterized protein n=1 Tax=Nicotiana tomentosiformis TaxID=4098 RepID=UPI00051C9077|nr:uncharacterized protein LOC104113264 isoform X1 [Nicotiana tomentosiformis]XP_033516435.1 uncharacterized protein LOC104113264 isoform X1 [Nicotiana tomentosiformis]XP_033516436.1 uncharacterized protein LOC104113264 isoform X1 [Nicotiana tomentosiformis]XP_033516437.1 uncharacterized protein LOC104113264 isoform X1 [Nicotiana tomentosiformis]